MINTGEKFTNYFAQNTAQKKRKQLNIENTTVCSRYSRYPVICNTGLVVCYTKHSSDSRTK